METDDQRMLARDEGLRARYRSVSGRRVSGFAVWPALAAVMLAACGGDGNGGGNEDTLFTGLSGVIILGVLIWFVWRKLKRRS